MLDPAHAEFALSEGVIETPGHERNAPAAALPPQDPKMGALDGALDVGDARLEACPFHGEIAAGLDMQFARLNRFKDFV
jgi:hypothetical protein